MKHTPGPWSVYRQYNVERNGRTVANCGGYTESHDWEGKVSAENEANARLIAAAPDLLDACEMAALEETNPHILAVLQAAIAKATEG